MSDSESNQEFEVKVELEQEAKVRQLIAKARLILPTYTEESLFNIYKESFQSENVFLNKLEIINKQKRNLEEEGQEEWHYSTKGEKTKAPPRQSSEQQSTIRQKYNFLEDKKLIERALKFNREDHQKVRVKKERSHQQYREKIEQKKEEYYPRQKQQNRKQNVNQSYREKKISYKQKQQLPQQVKNEIPSKPILQFVEKVQVKTYPQKKKKYAEKKEQPKQQEKYYSREQPKSLKIQQNKEPINTVAQSQHKSVIANNPLKDIKIQKHKPVGKEVKVETKQQQKKVVVQATSLIKNQVASPVIPEPVKEVKSQSTKKIEIPLEPEVEAQFQNSLRQNSFILKFIRPSAKLQKVSYTRSNNNVTDIKIRQPIQRKN